jgi:fringe
MMRLHSRQIILLIILMTITYLVGIYSSSYFTKHIRVNLTVTSNNNQWTKLSSGSFNNGSTQSALSSRDILLTIRTSKGTQYQRVPSILQTWFNFSPRTTHIITNDNTSAIRSLIPSKFHAQFFQSHCLANYSVGNLCCQSGSEFKIYFASHIPYQWMCRFDDDQYVNVPLLVEYLQQFSGENQALYIGKPSWTVPKTRRHLRFWFATYGGGVCYSRRLLSMIRDEVQPNGRFMRSCIASNDPDDIHIAYLLHTKFNINLTVAERFHHHLEKDLFTNMLNSSTISEAITLGFKGSNVPQFQSIFENDTFNMRTLHCLLYPNNDCMLRLRVLLNQVGKQKKINIRTPTKPW